MRTPLVVLSLPAVALAAPAAAAGPPPTLKATVTKSSSSADVKIVNHSSKTFTGFFINSTDSPKITAASSKACKMGTSPWASNGKKHVDYWADCKTLSVKPGQSVDVKLTTKGSGPIFVWAKSGTLQYKIATG